MLHPSGRYSRTLRLTRMAMFVALALATKLIPSPPGVGLLHFTGFPVILSGLVLGPWAGFCVGAVSDVLGFLMKPSGPFFPGFTLTQALTGAIPALIAGRGRPVYWRYLLGILVGQVLTSALMVPWFLSLCGLPFWPLATRSLYAQFLHAPLYAFGALAVVRAGARCLPTARPAAGVE